VWTCRATTLGSMALLELPQPYRFDLSTERFRAFGPALANLWLGGELHRGVGGQEVGIAPAPGGSDVEPLDAAIEAEVRVLLGLPFDLDGFQAWAPTVDAPLGDVALRLAGFRPP